MNLVICDGSKKKRVAEKSPFLLREISYHRWAGAAVRPPGRACELCAADGACLVNPV